MTKITTSLLFFFLLSCGSPELTPTTSTEDCANALDDNADGKIDCGDPLCAMHTACRASELCDNAVDDDANGKIDCEDSVCDARECGPGCTCIDGAKNTLGASSWDLSAWSTCSTECGSGTQSRTIACVDHEGMMVSETLCPTPKPPTSKTCNGATNCQPCTLPWGGSLAHGTSVPAYLDSLPDRACVEETRVCVDGTLSGTYTFSHCEPGCELPWGDAIPSGSSRSAYSTHGASRTLSCAQQRELRTCTEGVLSGSFQNENCLNYPCSYQGTSFMNEAVGFLSAVYKINPPSYVCYGNGSNFVSSTLHSGPTAPACERSGYWFDHGTCGFYLNQGFLCTGGNWVVSPGICPQKP